jgi:hypothetical protein
VEEVEEQLTANSTLVPQGRKRSDGCQHQRPYLNIFKPLVVLAMSYLLGIIQLQKVFESAERKASVNMYCHSPAQMELPAATLSP